MACSPVRETMRALFFALGALACSGCLDPGAELDAFRRRLPKVTTDGGADAGDGATCRVSPGEFENTYLLVLSVSIVSTKPIVALTEVTTPSLGSQTGIAFAAQPLSAQDRRTPVGRSLVLGPFPVDGEGEFRGDVRDLEVTGAANPVTPGADISADIVLTGSLCGDGAFFCGKVSGQVTKPLTLALDGSTFTLTRVDASGNFPSRPAIDCAGDIADPL